MAEVYDLSGAKLEASTVPTDDREAMGQIFDNLAKDAREGKIERVVALVLRDSSNYSTISYNVDTLQLLGAMEAAKFGVIMQASYPDDEATFS